MILVFLVLLIFSLVSIKKLRARTQSDDYAKINGNCAIRLSSEDLKNSKDSFEQVI